MYPTGRAVSDGEVITIREVVRSGWSHGIRQVIRRPARRMALRRCALRQPSRLCW